MRIFRKTAVIVATTLAVCTAFTAAGQAAQADTAAAAPCRGTTVLHEGNEFNEVPTTVNGSGVWRCVLSLGAGPSGAEGRAVWVLQRALIRCYDQQITHDSDYGTDTQKAVSNAQNFHNIVNGAGLEVDGIYGPETARWIEFVNSQSECWTLSTPEAVSRR